MTRPGSEVQLDLEQKPVILCDRRQEDRTPDLDGDRHNETVQPTDYKRDVRTFPPGHVRSSTRETRTASAEGRSHAMAATERKRERGGDDCPPLPPTVSKAPR